MDIDIDYARVIQGLSIYEKSLGMPLAESGHAQIFEKRIIKHTAESMHLALDYIGFLYDEYQKLKQENERQKTALLILKGKASRKKKGDE